VLEMAPVAAPIAASNAQLVIPPETCLEQVVYCS